MEDQAIHAGVRPSERIEWVDRPERFAGLAARWDQLAQADPTPFSRHDWLSAWWEGFGGDRQLSVCALWRGDRLAAAFPLLRDPEGGIAPMTNVHTPEFRVLAEDEPARRAVVRAAVEVAGDGPLVVRGLDEHGATLPALLWSARDARRLGLVEQGEVAPLIDTSGDWAAYRGSMRSRWGPLERKGRKMVREHDARFVLLEAPADLDRELDRFLAVEASGWKGRAGSAIACRPDTLTFYRALARVFHARGQLALSALLFGDRVVAADFSILHGRRLFSLKAGFDEELGQLSPGTVLRRAITERCFELGLLSQELLGDDLPWKRQFATGARVRRVFRTYPWRPAAVAEYGYRRFARPRLERAYDRSPGLRSAYGRVRALPGLRSL